jgi:hypothetical protein
MILMKFERIAQRMAFFIQVQTRINFPFEKHFKAQTKTSSYS